jgi:1-aminocyclopropane-1-carboxylate deaminase/D-cysteine desulfhydrase-like pyridoxal-dependent ACC family enzyme
MATFRPAPGLGAGLRRVVLGNLPTPLDHAPRLSAALGGPPILVKREDLSGLALGGNKTRQVEALLADVLDQNADTVVTTAAAQSNFCRTVAAGGAKLGLEVHLLLRGKEDTPRTGNLMLDQLLGAHIEFIATQEPYDTTIMGRLAALMDRLRNEGRHPMLLHMTAAAGPLGAAAYVPMAEELRDQFNSLGVRPAAVYLVASSGLTMAGLLVGFRALGLSIRVVGICAQTDPGFLRPLVLRRALEAAALLGLNVKLTAADIELDGAYMGPGYGIPDKATIAAMELAASTEGLILDPVYTGKAMAGLIAQIRAKRWRNEDSVMFVHSGGAPALFAGGTMPTAQT